MTWTKATFEMVAREMKAAVDRERILGTRHILAVVAIAEGFADQFAQANPRFDQARFLKACGIIN